MMGSVFSRVVVSEFHGAIPPPLTPPLKGEGNGSVAQARTLVIRPFRSVGAGTITPSCGEPSPRVSFLDLDVPAKHPLTDPSGPLPGGEEPQLRLRADTKIPERGLPRAFPLPRAGGEVAREARRWEGAFSSQLAMQDQSTGNASSSPSR